MISADRIGSAKAPKISPYQTSPFNRKSTVGRHTPQVGDDMPDTQGGGAWWDRQR